MYTAESSSARALSERSRFLPLLTLICLDVVPVVLILLSVLPFALRFWILVIVAALNVAVIKITRIPCDSTGLCGINWRATAIPFVLTTLPMLAVLVFSDVLGLAGRKPIPESTAFYLFYILVSSPCQEYIFRAALRGAVKRAEFGVTAYILSSSVLYAFLHVIYLDVLTLVVTLAIGLVWSAIYWRYPNFYLVSMSHAVLGLMTIRLGIV